jgi:hypothetical protein
MAKIMVLCEIPWISKPKFSTKEINHIDEVVNSSSFGKLDLVIDAIKNTIGPQ